MVRSIAHSFNKHFVCPAGGAQGGHPAHSDHLASWAPSLLVSDCPEQAAPSLADERAPQASPGGHASPGARPHAMFSSTLSRNPAPGWRYLGGRPVSTWLRRLGCRPSCFFKSCCCCGRRGSPGGVLGSPLRCVSLAGRRQDPSQVPRKVSLKTRRWATSGGGDTARGRGSGWDLSVNAAQER